MRWRMADNVQLNNYVQIVNLTAKVGEYHIGDGRVLKCGPLARGLKINKTEKFLREYVTPFIKSLETRGLIRIDTIVNGEVSSWV
jgi:hypothetical protein